MGRALQCFQQPLANYTASQENEPFRSYCTIREKMPEKVKEGLPHVSAVSSLGNEEFYYKYVFLI